MTPESQQRRHIKVLKGTAFFSTPYAHPAALQVIEIYGEKSATMGIKLGAHIARLEATISFCFVNSDGYYFHVGIKMVATFKKEEEI